MLVVSSDSNRVSEAARGATLEDAVRALPDYIKLLLPQHLLNKVHYFTAGFILNYDLHELIEQTLPISSRFHSKLRLTHMN